MDLNDIDRIAVSGRGWLHRVPAGPKLIALIAIIAVVLAIPVWPLYAAVLGLTFVLALTARVPMRTFIGLILYPLIFLIVLFLSSQHLEPSAVLPILARVLAITASVILVLLTTSYPSIFSALGRALPGGPVTALFFTYRSLFILSDSIVNARTSLHLRGGMGWRRPVTSVRNLGTALAHVLVHAIEISQRMAENLTIRGFVNRIYSLGREP